MEPFTLSPLTTKAHIHSGWWTTDHALLLAQTVVLAAAALFAAVQLLALARANRMQAISRAQDVIASPRLLDLRRRILRGSSATPPLTEEKVEDLTDEEVEDLARAFDRVAFLVNHKLLARKHARDLWAATFTRIWDALKPRVCEHRKQHDDPNFVHNFEELVRKLRSDGTGLSAARNAATARDKSTASDPHTRDATAGTASTSAAPGEQHAGLPSPPGVAEAPGREDV